jgi:hypothetical protein
MGEISVGIRGGMAGETGQSMVLRGAATLGLAALMWTGVGFSMTHSGGGPVVGQSIAADGLETSVGGGWATSSGVVEVAATNAWTAMALGALGVAAGGGLLFARRGRVAD